MHSSAFVSWEDLRSKLHPLLTCVLSYIPKPPYWEVVFLLPPQTPIMGGRSAPPDIPRIIIYTQPTRVGHVGPKFTVLHLCLLIKKYYSKLKCY